MLNLLEVKGVTSVVKDFFKTILIYVKLDLTKNIKYDRLTKEILKKKIKPNYNCVDVGCHKGEILDILIKYSPKGNLYAFEPIPYLFEFLTEKYQDKATVYPYALSDKNGVSTFQMVENAPAYSGLKTRRYDFRSPKIKEINVDLRTLDDILPQDKPIHFIKIDVEGGELNVLKGAEQLLKKNKPLILFECGRGALDYYNHSPDDIFDYLTTAVGLKIFTLQSFLKKKLPLDQSSFRELFYNNKEYYFIASS